MTVKTVKSADRSLLILEIIADHESGLTHSELSVALQIPKSSLTSLLSSLSHRKYLAYDMQTRRYHLGSKVLALAGRFLANIDLVQLGRSIVDELMLMTNESSSLTIQQGNQMLNVYKRNCPRVIMRSLEVGDLSPMYATAAGRSILAFMDEKEISTYLQAITFSPITKYTVTDPNRLLELLKIVRMTGAAYCREEMHEGSTAISAPVFDIFGKAVASLNVVFLTMRSTDEKEKQIEAAVRQAAQNLSEKLGYNAASENERMN